MADNAKTRSGRARKRRASEVATADDGKHNDALVDLTATKRPKTHDGDSALDIMAAVAAQADFVETRAVHTKSGDASIKDETLDAVTTPVEKASSAPDAPVTTNLPAESPIVAATVTSTASSSSIGGTTGSIVPVNGLPVPPPTTDRVFISLPPLEQYDGDQLMTVASATVSPHPIIAGGNSEWTLHVRISGVIAKESYAEMRLWRPIRFPLPTIKLKDVTTWDFQPTDGFVVIKATIKPPLPAAFTPAGRYIVSVDIVDPMRERSKRRVGSTLISFRVEKA